MMIYSIKRESDGTIHSSYEKLEDAKKVIKHLAMKGNYRVSNDGWSCVIEVWVAGEALGLVSDIIFDIEESCLHDSKATKDLIRSN